VSSHYLKILNWLLPWAQRVQDLPATGWQQVIFDDLTGGRGELMYVLLEPNHRGPRLLLLGETFACEAGLDADRDDSLFLSRIESADRRLPKTVPEKYPADLRLVTNRSYASGSLDSVAPLFGLEPQPRQHDSQPNPGGSLPASLRRVLVSMPADGCQLWRPGVSRSRYSDEQLLDEVRRLWRNYGLARFTDPPPRVHGILQGTLEPHRLKEKDRRGLLGVLNASALATLAREAPQRLETLLQRMAMLPLSESMRARLWIGLASGGGPEGLRRELLAAAVEEGTELGSSDWQAGFMDALRSAAADLDDQLLADRLDAGSDHDVDSVLDWVRGLEFQESPVADAVGTTGLLTTAGALAPVVIERLEPDLAPPEPEPEPEPEPGGADTPPDGEDVDTQTEVDADDGNSSEPSEEPREDVVERWVRRMRFGHAEEIDVLRREAAELLERVRRPLASWGTLSDLVAFKGEADSFRSAFDALVATFPLEADLERDLERARSAYTRLQAILGDQTDALLETGLDPREATAIAGLLELECLDSVPVWFWTWSAASDQTDGSASLVSRAIALTDPELRAGLEAVLDTARSLGDDTIAPISSMAEPEKVGDFGMFQLLFEEHVEELRGLASVGQEHQGWARRALEDGVAPEALGQFVDRIDSLRQRVSEEAGGCILESLETADEPLGELLTRWKQAIDRMEELVGSARAVPIDMLMAAVDRIDTSSKMTVIAAGSRFSVEQARVDATGRKVPLVWVPYADSERAYGVVRVPFRLRSKRRLEEEFRVSIATKGFANSAWPREWEEPGPERLRPMHRSWRRDGEDWLFDFEARIPTRQPKEIAHFEIKVSVGIGTDGVEEDTTSHWDRIAVWPGDIRARWYDGIRPESVDEHPIGPQTKAPRILDRLSDASNFAVLAPRRFGKSTLVEYLRQKAEARGFVVPQPLVCTQFSTGRRPDHERFWLSVSDGIEELLGTSVRRCGPDGLPPEDAFVHVREAATREGAKGVLVLVDEAQLLFPASDGGIFGSKLKDRLEWHWSRVVADGPVPILFGFVGLPSMSERGGNNLMGLLRPETLLEFQEAELNRLILNATDGALHTTRACRRVLSRRARNLFVLKLMLDGLVERVNSERRTWVGEPDLDKVEGSLKQRLSDGREEQVGEYLRDVFNEAFDITIWRPRPCFPPAVALARAWKDGHRTESRRQERAVELLNEWCERVARGQRTRPLYTAERLREHVAELEELGVYKQGKGYESTLLAAWLVGPAPGFPRGDAERRALVNGALQRVRIPDGLEPVGGGAQATVFRYSEPHGVKMALRKVSLESHEERIRFEESARTLGRLRDGVLRHDEGADVIYHLRHVGLADDPSGNAECDHGVEVYEWVDGVPLDQREGRLAPSVVALLGAQLARGVALLHRNGILHRDIRPANIILAAESGRPVLIDFGLARTTRDTMKTAMASSTSAPEVRSSHPKWTPAADVFSLGASLGALLKGETAPPLSGLLSRCQADDPEERPSAQEVAHELDEIVRNLHIDERQRDVWQTVQSTIEADLGRRWFASVVDKFRNQLIGIGLGLHDTAFDRAVEVAGFLDQLLEAYSATDSVKLKLGMVKHPNDATGTELATSEIDFLHRLRIHRSHAGGPDSKQRLLRRYGEPDERWIIETVRAASRQLGPVVGLTRLPALVDKMMPEQGSQA